MLHQPVTSRGQPTGACPNDSTAVCWQLPPPVFDTRPGARGGGCGGRDVAAAAGRRRRRHHVFQKVGMMNRPLDGCHQFVAVFQSGI